MKRKLGFWILTKLGWRPPVVTLEISGVLTPKPQVCVSLDGQSGGMTLEAYPREMPLDQALARGRMWHLTSKA
jgi:hypothetical protein